MSHPIVPTGIDTLVGFRLIRRIGSGSRSDVFLAKPAAAGSDTASVALKVFRPEAEDAGIGREVRALLMSPRVALPRLVDAATAPDGRVCLVLGHLPGLPLDRLLTRRGRISAGEAVTVVATVTATLQALHETGLTHPCVRASSVRFDQTGRPVVLGLGSLAQLPTGVAGVAIRRDAAVGLTGFLRTVLEHVDPEDAAAATAQDLLDTFTSTTAARPFPGSLAPLEAALFDWAAAGPVRQAASGTPEPGDSPATPLSLPRPVVLAAADRVGSRPPAGRPQGDRTAHQPGSDRVRASVPRRASRSSGGFALGSSLSRVVRVGRDGVDRIRSMRPAWLRSAAEPQAAEAKAADGERKGLGGFRRLVGRPPVLVAAAVGAVLTIGGWAALSATPPGTADRSRDRSVVEASVPGSGERSKPGSAPEETQGESDAGAESRPAAAPDPATAPTVLTGDDPAAAVLELLRLRQACLAQASVLCLDAVDQPGSVAMATDSYLIRQLPVQPGGPQPAEPESPVTAEVREHTGNSALVVLGDASSAGVNAQPASALVIKGEAGWRLRELFDY